MNKTELAHSVATAINCTKKDALAVVEATFATIQETLENGEKVAVTGFGTFEIHERSEKTCINPRTKEKMVCPPCKAPVFKVGSSLKEALKK
ncbi:MAG: HU family DNA-binding protein [Ruminococcus sp.]|nr:HU family DNA-binding protein [Ruminococcus sp.]